MSKVTRNWLGSTLVTFLAGASAVGCSAITHAGDYKTNECAVNADCPGENVICRKTDGKCVGLLTNECKEVLGDYRDDDALLLGATVALSGTNSATGIPERNALKLALSDFSVSANGLPPAPGSLKRRPLAVVVCDDAAATDVATRSAKHLTEDLRVPAIVGPTWSGVAVSLITNVTVPSQTLMLATGVTSPDLTSLSKDGLFFRTITSMVGETQAMSSLILDVEQMTKAATPNALTKVAMVHKGDSFGKGSAGAMQKSLVFNGLPALDQANQPNFQTLNYGDSGNPTASPLKYPETAAKLLEQKPRIIVSLGTGELLANIVQPVEAGWDPQAPRPYWIFAHPQFSGALTSFLNANDASGDLRKRILGATPGTEDANYQQFKANYATQVNDGTDPASFGCSNTYDGLYVAAFAAASLGGTPITGRSLASAIPKLVGSGQAISVGSNDLNQALSALSGGGTINLNGVSGPLDFDLATGDVKQPIQIWCIPADAAGKPKSPKTSGYSFGTDGTTPVGTFGLVKSSCAL